MAIFKDDDFKKSSFSYPAMGCVTVAMKDDVVAVRNSRDSKKVTLSYTQDEWKAFILGVKAGEFDL